MDISEQATYCPYCGESISILVDATLEAQEYVEDCEVCCKPIVISIYIDENYLISLNTKREDD